MNKELNKNIPYMLSKSSFLRGLQCPKSLYLYRMFPELRDEPDQNLQEIFRRGTAVGIIARDIFPGGADASPENYYDYSGSLQKTRELIDKGEKIIYEAAFLFQDVYCAVDILVRDNGKWRAYEVKSSTGINDVYIMDASVQYYIITGAGLHLEDISIVHLNKKYVRLGPLNLKRLFTCKLVTHDAESNRPAIESNINRLKEILMGEDVPDISIGEQCYYPYECDFRGHCWKDVPRGSVFNITRLSMKEKFELYNNGIISMGDVPDDFRLNISQRLQVECFRSKKTYIDKKKLKSFIDTIKYPAFFMDFETFMPAVPLFEGTRPYQQVPFQYSLHYRESVESAPEHFEFLAEAGLDPRRSFVENLLNDTDRDGCVLVYNKTFEITRLKELTEEFPEYKDNIKSLINRIIDLMLPFQKRYYYSPEMEGSVSLKKVLPAIVQGYSYEGLDIADGGTAMRAYEGLHYETDPARVKDIRSSLLLYCKMDTIALVKILERLHEII